ncbi:MAG TPA: hypothetical protein VMH02_07760 [Verrucomicrobiae bacterium]|nr:hypothetical protein [Verrucomicrobiae bacterium]
MRRMATAFVVVCTAALLVACGDAGDHFLEFRQNPSSSPTPTHKPTARPTGQPTSTPTTTPQTAVAKMTMTLSSTPDPQVAGTLTLLVTAFNSKHIEITAGTTLLDPIQLTSNASCNISFSSEGYSGTSLVLPTAPSAITVTYTPPSATCTAPSTIVITALNASAKPQSVSVSFAGEATIGSISLSMLSDPNPTSDGIYHFFVKAKDGKGKAIPAGTVLSNPIELASNASCVTTFGTSSAALTSTFSLTALQDIYLAYTPSNVSNVCSAPATIVVTAVAAGSVSSTFSFPGAGSAAAAKVSKLSLSMPSKPTRGAAGSFALDIAALTSKGVAIAPGTPFIHPIVLSSNSSCAVSFTSSSGATGASLTLASQPGSVIVAYTPPSGSCTAPSTIEINAFDQDAKPQNAAFALVGGTSTVGSVALSLSATPNPTSIGNFNMTLTAKDTSGKLIPNGSPLTNAIEITSNATCVTTFGTGGTTGLSPSLTLDTATSLVILGYNPTEATTTCPTPNNIKVTASASGAKSGSVSFVGANPTPTPAALPVSKVTLSMPATPNPISPGTFTLVVSPYAANGSAIAAGTPLGNPIQLTSNSSCSVTFVNGGTNGTALTLTSAPGSVEIQYTPAGATCNPPTNVIVSAFNLNASPQSSSLSLLGGTDTVASIALSFITDPDPTSEGVYPLFVTAKDGSGATIPYGTALNNPIQLSSNTSCATMFGTNPAGNFFPLYSITSMTPIVYVQFDPAPTCLVPTSGETIITALSPYGASGSVHTSLTFPY